MVVDLGRAQGRHDGVVERPGAVERGDADGDVIQQLHGGSGAGLRRGPPPVSYTHLGKLDGYAIRVPTINVSIVDLSFVAKRDTTVEEVNSILKAASEGELKGILDYNTEPLVSVDYNHNPASSTVDASLTKVSGRLVKVSSWYDNEWGFSNRMLDTTVALMSAK